MAQDRKDTKTRAGRATARRAETPLSPGQLFGPYRILREIGRGGMGVVYLAREATLDRLVAVKVAYSRVSDSSDVAQRVLEEARAAARLEHPGVVRIYAAGTHGGRPYVAMEYVAGQSLAQVLASRSPLDEGRAMEIVRQVSLALAAAHAAGLVHGDIKPANVQLTPEGRVKVMDFGIARPVGARGADDDSTFVGTPDYASPEQALGSPLDGRSDMFSLGLVLHEMLTGDLPFEGGSPTETLRARCRTTLTVRDFPASISLPVRALLARLLERKAEARYPSMAEVAHDAAKLQGPGRKPLDLPVDPDAAALITHETETAIVVRESRPDSSRRSRRPVGLLVSGVLAGLVAGLVAGQAFLSDPPQAAALPVLAAPAPGETGAAGVQPLAVAFRFDPGNEQAGHLRAAERIRARMARGLRDFPLPVSLDTEARDLPVRVEGKVFASEDKVWLGALLKDREGRILHSSVVTGARADLNALLADMAAKLLEALTEILFNAYGGGGEFSARVSL